MQEDKTQGKSGRGGELVAGIVLSIKATWNEIQQTKAIISAFTLCPQLTTLKIIAKQTTNILMVYVWMICLLHMLPPKQTKKKTKQKRGKNQRSSFPHKAQDKINPIYIFKAKMSAFLAFVCFFCYYMSID